MTSVDSNFNFLCGRPHGLDPPPPVHMRPPEPDPLPLRVDVINGWPLRLAPKLLGQYNVGIHGLHSLGIDTRSTAKNIVIMLTLMVQDGFTLVQNPSELVSLYIHWPVSFLSFKFGM